MVDSGVDGTDDKDGPQGDAGKAGPDGIDKTILAYREEQNLKNLNDGLEREIAMKRRAKRSKEKAIDLSP